MQQMKKINFIVYKLYRFLTKSDFRTKVNMYKIFAAPLLRMCLSICGWNRSSTSRKNLARLGVKTRCTLKKFTLSPKYADNKLFD